MRPKLIISTVGTSLLSNVIGYNKEWRKKLQLTSNLRQDEIDEEMLNILNSAEAAIMEKLRRGNIKDVRNISAELNGVFGVYEAQPEDKRDIHFLIASDTVQGRFTARLIDIFLKSRGSNSQVFVPPKLCTANTEAFSSGIKELIEWCDQVIPGYIEKKYKVIFNLVGGFKSIQGFMNTIGMFYADEMIYIFESPNSELIKIPRLPIKIDSHIFKKYAVQFALMAQNGILPETEIPVHESLIDTDGKNAMLSGWGLLTWNNVKKNVLKDRLLDFPYIRYSDSF